MPNRHVRREVNAGFTLLELLLAVAILAMLAGALVGAVHGVTRAYQGHSEEAELARSAGLAMHRLRHHLENATAVIYPTEGATAVDSMVIEAGVDEDGDRRVNEDPPGDDNKDGRPGIRDVDDDGDGLVDEDLYGRQPGDLMYAFAEADLTYDDDEDGVIDEDPVTYVRFRLINGVLYERIVDAGGGEASYVDASHVRRLTAHHGLNKNGDVIVDLDLVLGTDSPDSMTFHTAFHPANVKKTMGTRTDG